MGLADRAGRGAGLRTHSLHGASVLTELGSSLDDLLEDSAAPITFRRPWLEAWVAAFTGFEPWAIAVYDGPRLDGVALLGRRRRLGHTEIVPMGHGPSDAVRLPTRNEEGVEALANALVEALAALRGPWRLVVGQIPAGDSVASRVANAWPDAELGPGDGSPALAFGPGDTLEDHASTGYMKHVRRGWRLLQRSGDEVALTFVREADDVARLLPELGEVRRRRDAAFQRGAELDQPEFARFLQVALVALARRSEVEIAVLRVGGRCAGYAICLVDGSAFRLWQTSFDPEWRDASPGRLILAASVERVLAHGGFDQYDFMRGVYEWKMALADTIVPSGRLLAWSSGRLRAVEGAARRLRARLRRGGTG